MRTLIKAAAAIGIALLVSGCVVYPAPGPYHWHPYYWR